MADDRNTPKNGLEREVRRHQEELQRSNSLLNSVLESPKRIVIFSLDSKYRYTAFNTNHRNTMKKIWDTDIQIGLNMLDVIKDPADRSKAKVNFDRVLAGEQFTKTEEYGESPNRFYYEDSYNPIFDSSKKVQGLTVFLTDITERRRRDEELQRYRNRLETLVDERTRELRLAYEQLEQETGEREKAEALLMRSQRLEALGTLAGGVAHDFNNILTAIVGYSDLLLSDLPEVEYAPEYLQKIKLASQHGSSLTSRLLAFSRRQVLQSTLVDLSDAVAQMVDLFRHVLPEDIHLTTDLQKPMALVRADPGQIEQVIMNLVLNARDAMPQGGTLEIQTTLDNEDWICLSVQDTGTGIKPEVLEQMFDPFFTTKDGGRGSGLGLSMVYGIVEQHGGTVQVESELRRGTSFLVKLPAILEATPESHPREKKTPMVNSETRKVNARILLVEDDNAIRNMARRLLLRHGYETLEAATYAEAIQAYEEWKGDIDLLFSDVVLPDQDGVALARELTSRQPGLRILLASGYSATRVAPDDLLSLPSYRFLSKPYDPQTLISSIEELLLTQIPPPVPTTED